MKLFRLIFIILVSFLISCTSKRKIVDQIREISYYCGDVQRDKNLSTSITEGEIEYGLKFAKKGGFEYYEHFYPDNMELVWVEYSASTNINLIENYFYKDNELIFAESFNADKTDLKEKVFLKNGKVFYESRSDFFKSERLVEKGNEYLTEFKAGLSQRPNLD